MSPQLTAVVGVSLAALAALLALWARKTGDWRAFWFELAALVAFVAFLNRLFGFPFPPAEVVAKGKSEDFLLAGALFLCMLLGMVSQYLYRRFEKPRRRRTKWDWGIFIAPVFASPIVFIPLLAAFQNANINLKDLTVPRLMIFFVAYQNGFFWKEFFDRKQREETEKKPMKKLLAASLLALHLSSCLFAQQDWPSGVTRTPLSDGVVRFDRTTTAQAAYWWQLLLDYFSWKPAKGLPFRRSVAFLAGVSRYDSLVPHELRFVETDVTELRNFLLTGGGFDTVLEVRNSSVTRSLIER